MSNGAGSRCRTARCLRSGLVPAAIDFARGGSVLSDERNPSRRVVPNVPDRLILQTMPVRHQALELFTGAIVAEGYG
jgi:hypothetical protein